MMAKTLKGVNHNGLGKYDHFNLDWLPFSSSRLAILQGYSAIWTLSQERCLKSHENLYLHQGSLKTNPGMTLVRGEQEQNSLESFENQRLLQQAVDVSRKEITLVGGLVINNG